MDKQQRRLLMSLILVVATLSTIAAMSQVQSQTVLSRLVGTWAVCTLDVEDCIKVKVHNCKEQGDRAMCEVSLP